MFSPDLYLGMLNGLRDNGWRFAPFLTEAQSKTVHLRHDIDFSVPDALAMATLEKAAGIHATYFFMVSSNTYNPLSAAHQEQIRAIKAMGHDISLHFDPAAYEDIDEGFKVEKALFESLFDTKLGIISIHRPGPFLNDNNRQLPGSRHTYEDSFFRDMTYLSDSGGRNILENITAITNQPPATPLHLLIHPVWWTGTQQNPTATLEHWLERNALFLREETRRNCKTFQG